MTLEDLQKVQQLDSEILFHVADICQKHNIQFVLIYGTLLGAVRHGGPIPWDDDVDIAMTRENYMKFLKIADEELDHSKYELRIMGSGSADYVSEIKIGCKGTLYCMPGTENLDIMKMIQLDIFLVDYMKPMSPIRSRICNMIRSFLMLAKLNWSEKQLLLLCLHRGKRHAKWFYAIGLYVMHGFRWIVGERNMEHLIYSMYVDKSKKSPYMGVAHLPTLYFWDADDFNHPIFLKYEGRLFPVPNHYEKALTLEYGDYMQFPPEEKRLRKGFEEWVCQLNNNE